MKMGLARLKEIINEEARSIVEAVIGGGEDTSDEPTVEEPVGGEPAVPATPPDSEAQPLLDLVKDFLASPVASAAPRTAEYLEEDVNAEQIQNFMATHSSIKDANYLHVKLNESFANKLLKDMSDAAEDYYQNGNESAGGNYMLIKQYVQEKLNDVIKNYGWKPIPDTDLWVTVMNTALHRVVPGHHIPRKYSDGDMVPPGTIVRISLAGGRGGEPWAPLGVIIIPGT